MPRSRLQGGLLSTFAHAVQLGARSELRRKRKKRTKRSARSARTRATRRVAKSAGRKLKFGTPAWRKKYMKKRRKK